MQPKNGSDILSGWLFGDENPIAIAAAPCAAPQTATVKHRYPIE